jgi:vitamin B12 transporter
MLCKKTISVRSFILFLFLFLIFNSTESFGQSVEELQPLKIEATRSNLPLEDLPTSVSIITRKDIEEKNYSNVEDMLREELGLDVTQNGSMGASTAVSIRGGSTSSTLVMVDGVQVNSNTLGQFNFADIQSDNVERIEILRGPQSTMWGADAVGGVINIVTRKGKGKPRHYFSFEGGSFATFKETLGSSGSFGEFDYSVTASRTDSEGFSSANEKNGNTEKDGYQNTSLSARTGINFMQGKARAEFIGMYIDSRIEFDNFSFGVGFVDGPPYTSTDSFAISTPLTFNVEDWWDIKLVPSVSYDESRTRNATFPDSDIVSKTSSIDLQNNFNFADYYSVILGGEYQNRNGSNNSSDFDEDLKNASVYLQGIFDYQGEIVLTGGVRFDDNNKFDDATTYKLEGAYRFKKHGTRLRAAYATGFRAPTINDLFFPGFSNPDLKPEEVESWEVGLDQTFMDGKIKFSTVYFDADYDELIQFSSDTFRPENIAKASSKGVETSINLKLPNNFFLGLNHTWNEAIDKSTGEQLRRRAEHKFHTNLQHNWCDKLKSTLGLTYRGETNDGSVVLDSYVVVRSSLVYQYNKKVKFTLRGENLFDEEYEEISGFGTAGISGYAGFTYSF